MYLDLSSQPTWEKAMRMVATQDVKRLCNAGQLIYAVQSANSLTDQGIIISSNIFLCLLQLCIQQKDLAAGRQVYSLIIRNGLEKDTFLGCHLIRMFSSCGSLMDAEQTFLKLPVEDSCTWSAIILAHIKFAYAELALNLYSRMCGMKVEPCDYTYNAALQACSMVAAISQGNVIYSNIIEHGLESDIPLSTTLINMYAKCACLEDAKCVFDFIPKPGIVAWCSIISAHADWGEGHKALQLFAMLHETYIQPNLVMYISILKACSSIAHLKAGKLVHALIAESNCPLNLKAANILIDMYGKSGSIEDAKFIFDQLFERTVVTWSIMFLMNADHGLGQVTLQLFWQMQHEGVEYDCASFAGILKACSHIRVGKFMHVLLLEKGSNLDDLTGSILIEMYFRLHCPSGAHKVFGVLPKQHVQPWNAMIAGSFQRGCFKKAMFYFEAMQAQKVLPDNTTYANVITACSATDQVAEGKLLFAFIIEECHNLSDIVGNALISMYAKCGNLIDACRLFDRLLNHDAVAWTALIAGCVLHSHGYEALRIFCRMQFDNKASDNVTFSSVVKACTLISAIDQGMIIHAMITDSEWELNVQVGNSLIDMYSKCGSFHDALSIFKKLPEKNAITWNALITGLVYNNRYPLAFELFKVMQHEGPQPNDATFSSLLSACDRFGLVHDGCLLFKSLINNLGPKVDHYASLTELLSHAGLLINAHDLVSLSPFRPGIITWTSLLNNSKVYGDVDIGKQSFRSLITIRDMHVSE
ncbi:hypothetical protein KP509_18G013900 [Ceratopteris richardii]|nr:hypothetical protein KP509_18G013900 [Ceratopteris richardii]